MTNRKTVRSGFGRLRPLLYLYAVVEAVQQPLPPDLDAGAIGPPRLLTSGDLGCVVSDCNGPGLDALPKEQVLRSLLAYQRVAERLMYDRAVLPIRFGTIVESRQQVQALLTQGGARFRAALASCRDKVEVEVAATWDTSRVLQEIGQEEEVQRLKAALGATKAPSIDERVHLGRFVKTRMDLRRQAYRQRMLDVLQPLSLDFAPNLLAADELVMNVAFLIERGRQPEFDQRVHQLDELFDDQIAFRVIEPLPPYSFSTIEVVSLSPEAIAEARQVLQLHGLFGAPDVRAAYRRLAAESQRSPAAAGQMGQAHLASLRGASELLLRCCTAIEQTGNIEEAHHEGQDLPNPLFEISIKRARLEEEEQIDPAAFGGAVSP